MAGFAGCHAGEDEDDVGSANHVGSLTGATDDDEVSDGDQSDP